MHIKRDKIALWKSTTILSPNQYTQGIHLLVYLEYSEKSIKVSANFGKNW